MIVIGAFGHEDIQAALRHGGDAEPYDYGWAVYTKLTFPSAEARRAWAEERDLLTEPSGWSHCMSFLN